MGSRLDSILVKMGFDTSEASKVGEAMNKVKQESGKGAEALEGFNLKGREGHELIRKIGESSPVMGAALKAAFSPEAAGIVAFSVALNWVIEGFNKAREAIRAAAEESVKMWTDSLDAENETKLRLQEFEKQINENTQALSRQTDVYKEQAEAVDRLLAGHLAVSNAIEDAAKKEKDAERSKRDEQQKKQEDAALDAVKNPQQREALRQQFEAKHEQQKKQDAYDDAVAAREKEKADQQARAVADAAKVRAGQQALRGSLAEQRKANEEVESAKAGLEKTGRSDVQAKANERALAELEKKLPDLEARAMSLKSMGQEGGVGGLEARMGEVTKDLASGGGGRKFSVLQAEAQKQLESAQQEYAERKATQERLSGQQKSAQEAAAEAAKHKNEADQKHQKLNESLTKQQADLAATQKTNQAVGAIHDQNLARMKNDLGTVPGETDMFGRQVFRDQNGKPIATDMWGNARGGFHPGLPDDQKKGGPVDGFLLIDSGIKLTNDFLKSIADAITGDESGGAK